MTKLFKYTALLAIAAILTMYVIFPALVALGMGALLVFLPLMGLMKYVLWAVAAYLGYKGVRYVWAKFKGVKDVSLRSGKAANSHASRRVDAKEVEFMFSKEM